MTFFIRKPRSTEELLNDPDFIARAFRLLGCSEMVVTYMLTLDDPKAKQMADKLGSASDWFFENDDLGGWSPRRRPRYTTSVPAAEDVIK